MAEFWVFGYGSLMWRPGFAPAESRPALLRGAHRALCVYSVVHRGSEDRPGLVLGLDAGGACRGLAFRVEPEHAQAVRTYLRDREQVTLVYREACRPVDLLDGSGRRVHALCYLVDRSHPQYAGLLPLPEQAELVRQGQGASGDNVDYLANTVRHLAEMGIEDRALVRLLDFLEADTPPRSGAKAPSEQNARRE